VTHTYTECTYCQTKLLHLHSVKECAHKLMKVVHPIFNNCVYINLNCENNYTLKITFRMSVRSFIFTISLQGTVSRDFRSYFLHQIVPLDPLSGTLG